MKALFISITEPCMIGDEESLLQRIHQGGTEFVSVGEAFGARSLFRVASGAVEKSPGRDVQRGQRLQQEFQCDGRVDANVFRQFEDHPDVLLDDVEHADLFLQRPAPELMGDGQAVLVARVQVGLQRSDVLRVKIFRAGHVRSPPVTCGEHQGVVGLFRMFSQHLLGYRRGGSGEVDVVEVVLVDPVGGDHDQIAGAKRKHLRRPDFGYPVADDASGQPRAGSDVNTRRVLGDQVCGDVSDPGPGQRAAREIHPRQGHRGPPGSGQHAMAELNQDFDPLARGSLQRLNGAHRGSRGVRSVAETVDHPEQRGVVHRCRPRSAGHRRRARPAVDDPRSPIPSGLAGHSHARSRTGRNPFPHFDDGSVAERGFHDQPVHQSARTRQAHA